MIAPQELRLRNYVEYKGYFYQVWSIGNNSNPRRESYFIDLDSSTIDNHLKGVDSNDVYPIDLTEDWLLKFGFEKISSNVFRRNDYDVLLTKIETRLVICNYMDIPPSAKLKYVHQLQNLFFALTGEELKIKES